MAADMTPEMISLAVERLRALAEETRVRIMMRLREAGELGVNDLAGSLGLRQPSTSKHLAVLKRAGIVGVRREGTQSYYSIKDTTVFGVCDLVCSGVRRHHEELSRAAGIVPHEMERSSPAVPPVAAPNQRAQRSPRRTA